MRPRFALASLTLFAFVAACASGASSTDEPDPEGTEGPGGSGGSSAGAGGASGGSDAGKAGTGGSTTAGTNGAGTAGSGAAGKGGGIGAGMAGTAGTGGGAVCGNGKKDGTEACDGTDLAGQTCATVLKDTNQGGILKCTAACQFDTAGCKANPTCGDNAINTATEECDGADFGTASCASKLGNTNASGTLKCTAACKVDTSGCMVGPFCGDAKKNGSEACDGADFGSETCKTLKGQTFDGTLTCKTDCTIDSSKCVNNPICGDGSKNTAMEQCDGTDLGGATCATLLGDPMATGTVKCTAACAHDTTLCTIPPYCGDKKKNGGEACDTTDFGGSTCQSLLGTAYSGALTCTAQCTVSTASCTKVPICGDNLVNVMGEQCDGTDLGGKTCASVVGNGSTGTLACFPNCTFNSSGCTPPVLCGNGQVDGGEACDGNNFGGKNCASVLGNPNAIGSLSCNNCALNSSGCSIPPYCGDGKLAAGEECDDGNTATGDLCENCKVVCYSGDFKLGTHCYGEYGVAPSFSPTTWQNAKSACESAKGHLVTITSTAEANLVWDNMDGFTDTGPRWIGYSDLASEGSWSWVTGEANPPGFSALWASGEPNDAGGSEDCAEFRYSQFNWNDNQCTVSHYFWCEFEPQVQFP